MNRPLVWPCLFLVLLVGGCGLSLNTNGNEPVTTTTTAPTTTTVGCYLGAYVNGISNTASFETLIGQNLALNMLYLDFNDDFPTADCTAIDNYGGTPVITWEPFLAATATLEALCSGAYDSYISAFAQAAKTWGKMVYLRPAHEMNGDWYGWTGAGNGCATGPAKYVAAWRYIHGLFTAAGAGNVKFIWSPNNASHPDETWNLAANYYPGDQYVDWVAFDGYNWGDPSWQTFDRLFQAIYSSLEAYNKPIMIGEFACAETGGDKTAWITDAFSKIKNNYPKVKAAVWFNINKEKDWRLESSAGATAAFKTAVQDSYFSGSRPNY